MDQNVKRISQIWEIRKLLLPRELAEADQQDPPEVRGQEDDPVLA